MKNDIYKALRKHFEAHIDKHAMNVRIMISNPMAIHDHTDFMSAVEAELAHMAEYQDKLEALEYVVTQMEQG
jgi:hypothetical protein